MKKICLKEKKNAQNFSKNHNNNIEKYILPTHKVDRHTFT